MISARMHKIIELLDEVKATNYKSICKSLDLSERIIRYDVECINNELSIKNLPLIEKHSKGKLIVPNNLDLSVLLEDREFIFTQDERVRFIQLNILFDITNLNIRKLCELFQVTRRSIQNDLDIISKSFSPYNIKLVYDKHFQLSDTDNLSYTVRINVLKKYIYLLGKKQNEYNTFEYNVFLLLQKAFHNLNIDHVYKLINRQIHTMHWTFSDSSYEWYVANILTTVWYIINDYSLPEIDSHFDLEIGFINDLEDIIGIKLSVEQKNLISNYLNFTNKYDEININLDLIMTEELVFNLIDDMSNEIGCQFRNDTILVKGLLNHMAPLLERNKNHITMHSQNSNLIPDQYHYVLDNIKKSIANIEKLNSIDSDEMVCLAIHFIGSLQRLRINDYKKVLIICGRGYGATTLLKDTLRNEYQMYIVDSIPGYEVEHYKNWQEVDVVIMTSHIKLPLKIPCAVVNTVFSYEDHIAIERLGINKKNVLSNYINIEKNLNFLSTEDKKRTLEVIKKELGYIDVNIPESKYKLTDLIGYECIKIVDKYENWKESIFDSVDILSKIGATDSQYAQDIIDGIKESGFYSVTDNEFALLHGAKKPNQLISSMSLIITREAVVFGRKKVNIIFCLASKDNKEHIPAIVQLMRMIKKTHLLEELLICENEYEVISVIHKCEEEVKSENTFK